MLDLLTRTELFLELQRKLGGLGSKTFNRMVPFLPKVYLPGIKLPRYRLADVLTYLASVASVQGEARRPLHRHRPRKAAKKNHLGNIA